MKTDGGAVAQRRLFRAVKTLVCIFCDTEYPIGQKDFRTMNKHGWGCCGWCWKNDIPKMDKVIIRPENLRAMQKQDEIKKLYC